MKLERRMSMRKPRREKNQVLRTVHEELAERDQMLAVKT